MELIDKEKVLNWANAGVSVFGRFPDKETEGKVDVLRDLITMIEAGMFAIKEPESPAPTIQKGDKVRHKKDKSLVLGTVKDIAQSGIRARVGWEKKDNPRLLWYVDAYYRMDLLEPLGGKEEK